MVNISYIKLSLTAYLASDESVAGVAQGLFGVLDLVSELVLGDSLGELLVKLHKTLFNVGNALDHFRLCIQPSVEAKVLKLLFGVKRVRKHI